MVDRLLLLGITRRKTEHQPAPSGGAGSFVSQARICVVALGPVRQKAASGTSISALSMCVATSRSPASSGSTVRAKKRAAATLPV